MPEVVNFCYECNTKECNSKHNFDNAFKCYESNGKLSSKIAIGCNSNKCYLASNIKEGDSEEILDKHTKQGCGDCPQVEGQCRTCTEKLCNSLSFYRKQFYACRTFNDKYVICAPGTEKCYYGENKAGCGKCEGDSDCFECNTKYCNAKENFNKVFRCYESNGKITYTKARECEKKKCYLAFNIKG
uniref:Uncharacterized protein n=1 Tax=Meloidogyne enterolobii TaxID=390850 RepID=A0A6V7V5D5_MELEN|nr:unnamed protein product [Meloidogyne enterolobii]